MFQKGHVPECPIKKGQRISPGTEFKKGLVPKNKLPVGSVTIRTDDNGRQRAWIKISEPNVWIFRAVHVWLENGGQIPEGFVIHHDDRNSLNDNISNLRLVTRATHRLIHSDDLMSGKTGGPLPTKTIVCGVCGDTFDGKAQRTLALCKKCRKVRHNENCRAYKERIRSGS